MDKRITITFQIDKKEHQKLKFNAKKDRRSLSAYIELVLISHLAKEDNK